MDYLRRLYFELFGVPALKASRRVDAFEQGYGLARKCPTRADNLLGTLQRAAVSSDLLTDFCAGLRAGLRDERMLRQHTTGEQAAGGAGGERI